ncbi:MAG: AraC family transcriptional regulator [Pseudomonadota bacterium]
MTKQIPMTHGTGMGPLPDLLEIQAGSRAITRVFAAEGVPLGLIEDRVHWLPLASLAGLFEGAARETGDPVFGFSVGVDMQPVEYGLWARFALQAPTLGEAIARLSRYMYLHQIGGELRLTHRRDGRVALHYVHVAIADPFYRHHTDHVIPVLIRFVRAFLGPNWTPDAVEVPYANQGHASVQEAVTGAPWLFQRRRAALVMPSAALQHRRAPTPTADGAAAVTSFDVVNARATEDCHDVSAQLSAILALRLLDRLTDIDGAAQMMGVSRRTLQRRLDAEGASYSDRLDAVRLGRARALIEETTLPLTAIAFDVGYSDPAHLTRAFRRYFGCPPSHLRDAPTDPEAETAGPEHVPAP